MRRAVVTLLVLALPALAACGDKAPSKAEFLGKADPVCKRGNELAAATTAPGDLNGLKDFMTKMADNVDKTTKELDDLDLPGGEDGKAAEGFIKAMKDAGAAARAVAPEVDKGNFTAIEDNAKKAADGFRNADAQARTFGSTECGKGEAEASAKVQAGATVKTAFIAKVDPLCTAAQKELAPVLQTIDEEDPASVASVFGKILAAGEKLTTDIKAIPAPLTDKDKLDEWFAVRERVMTKIREVQKAAQDQDEEKFLAAAEEMQELGTEATGKASAYGLKACGTGS